VLLPLVAEPFTAPTDRDLLPSERREFMRTTQLQVLQLPEILKQSQLPSTSSGLWTALTSQSDYFDLK
jgi:hypothetical protein